MTATLTSAPVRVTKTGRTSTEDSSGARANLVLLLVGLGALAVSLSQSILVPVLSILPGRLGTSATNVSWLLTSTLLVAAGSVPIMGRLGDMFGKRRMLLVAIGALALGSLVTALSDDIGVLIVGRAIQGVSAAAIPLGISLRSTAMPREKVGSSIALVSAMLGIGGALGLPLAGFVAEHADFHVLFWINAALGAVAFFGIFLAVPEPPARSGGRLDWTGSVLLAAGLVSLLLPLSQGGDWGWTDAKTITLLGAAVVILAAFGATQTRIAQPLVDLKALRSRPIVLVNLASICFGFALFASFIGSASYVESPTASGYGFGASLLIGGLVLLPSGIAMLLLAPVAAKLIARRGAPPDPRARRERDSRRMARTHRVHRPALAGLPLHHHRRHGHRHRLRRHPLDHQHPHPGQRARRRQRTQHALPQPGQLTGLSRRRQHPRRVLDPGRRFQPPFP